MNLSFSQEADTDLDAIKAYIADTSPQTATSVLTRILQSVAMLENFPLLGREGRVPGTRELTISNLPYFAVYRIVDETDLTILRIMHTSRRYPLDGSV